MNEELLHDIRKYKSFQEFYHTKNIKQHITLVNAYREFPKYLVELKNKISNGEELNTIDNQFLLQLIYDAEHARCCFEIEDSFTTLIEKALTQRNLN